MRDALRLKIFAMCGTAALGLGTVSAHATEVKYPITHPQVAISVPDGWSIDFTPTGLELRSPEKNSIILASLMKRDKVMVDAWTKKVLARMQETGVSVDATATVPAEVKAATDKAAGAKTPAVDQTVDKPLPGTPDKPTFAFAGAPSLATPKLGPTPDATAVPPVSGETSSELKSDTKAETMPAPAPATRGGQKAPSVINGLHFQSILLYGGTFNGKPTDMQLVLFSLPKDEVFAVEQQSTPEDNRAVQIVFSVKPLKH